MSKRTNILLQQVRRLVVETRNLRAERDDLRDNAAARVDALTAELQDTRDERDDALARLNARAVIDGERTYTLDDFANLP